jgi:hypothetical protein
MYGTSSYSSGGLGRVWVSIALLFVAVCGGFISLHVQQQQLITALQDSIKVDQKAYEQRVKLIGAEVHSQQDEAASKYSKFEKELGAFGMVIGRLDNRTTNADVLDQLKKTHGELLVDMDKVKADVGTALADTQRSMNAQLTSNSEFVLEAQNKARSELVKTEVHVQNILDAANNHVHQLQHNVSDQMQRMVVFMQDTVARLNQDIADAESKIGREVDMVQANVDKYVDITNKQFAQEDDFVRFQLAGTFTMLGSLISLYVPSPY